MREADLTRVRLHRAQLQGTDLRGAKMDGVNFKDLNNTGARLDIQQAVAVARSYGAKVGD